MKFKKKIFQLSSMIQLMMIFTSFKTSAHLSRGELTRGELNTPQNTVFNLEDATEVVSNGSFESSELNLQGDSDEVGEEYLMGSHLRDLLASAEEIIPAFVTDVYGDILSQDSIGVIVKYLPHLRKLIITPRLHSGSNKSYHFTEITETYGERNSNQILQNIISHNQIRINKAITLVDRNGVEREYFYEDGRAEEIESSAI
jgi:hypothetical protein